MSINAMSPLHASYETFVDSPVDYRILQSAEELSTILNDARYWRVVEMKEHAVQMLRVPFQVSNNVLLQAEQDLNVHLASRSALAAAFRTSENHQYQYPWGDHVSAAYAPFLMHSNPQGMGMNIAGLYFNGPDNAQNPFKNGLWMVTAERDAKGKYVTGDRSGTAGNVGVFETAEASGNRGLLPEERGILPGSRGVLAQSPDDNFLTPAGIGEGFELYPNEGYLIIKNMTPVELDLYQHAKKALNNKISADHGISLIGIGYIADASPIIAFGVAGHCMLCPNPRSLTMPINGPLIADEAGIAVIEYPEFKHHHVQGRKAIMPQGLLLACHETPGQNRIYTPRL